MSLKWKSCKIGDVVSVRRGASPRPIKDYVSETGMPWVKIADATKDQTRFINFTNEFIKEEGIEKSVVVNPGDLIVSNSATPGLPKFMNIKACVHDGWLVFDSYNGILKDFLYYYFIVIRGQLVNQANGSVFKNLKTDIVRNFDINLPDLETQKKIVKILSQIDKKIEINIEINKNLEELMHVLFKKYFIDNNPFYVENDEKWNIIKLKDLIIRNRDKINDFDNWKDELLIDLSNMPRFSIAISNFDKGKKFTSNIYKLNKYDLLFGSIRPYFGKVGFSPINGVVTGTVHSFKPIDDIYYSLVLSLISSKTFINYTVSVSKGTKMPSVKWDDFINYEFAIPDDLSKIGEYNKILLPLIHKIEKNILEIQRLTKLRDTLLPKLMSGEIDVSKINCDLE